MNRYGPAPAAVAALRSIEPEDTLLHPYDAAERLKAVYEWATGVDASDLVAGRGASEFIWAMGRQADHASAAIPLPGYTDYLKAFPGRGFSTGGEQMPSLEQIDAALSVAALVILSNPHNPTGMLLDPDGLVALAAEHPRSTLVVDESYINFTPDRSGCHDRRRGRARWLDLGRPHARADALRQRVAGRRTCRDTGLDLRANRNVHFQYAFSGRAHQLAEGLRSHGIGVRVLSRAHGVVPDALRIVAPRADERERFAASIRSVIASDALL